MNIKSKAFWLQVKEEAMSNNLSFLCNMSDTFKDVWLSKRDNKGSLKELGNTFLKETQQRDVFVVSEVGIVLFDTITRRPIGDTWTIEDYYQLRLDFIDWCIEKFD